MTTKTISVDLGAYDRLQHARIRPDESFSQVIKRASWNMLPSTGAALLEAVENAPLADEAVIQRLEAVQQEAPTPKTHGPNRARHRVFDRPAKRTPRARRVLKTIVQNDIRVRLAN